MELNNSFEVTRSVEDTWAVLTDVERIAPCLPGAQLQEVEGEEYRGIVKVKVGPITAQYKGAATFLEKNDDDHKAVLDAKGRDTRGAGNAEAIITATLEAVGETATRVDVSTDLKVTGKVAQFGRGVMADVSAKLMDQFAANLSETVISSGPAEAASPPAAVGPVEHDGSPASTRQIDQPEVAPIDLMDAAGGSVAKRLVPMVVAAVALVVVWRLVRRRR